ncbi:MAG: tetratricopeptide repeat protein, partial [Bdellovibrionales bacterium]
VHGRKKEIEFYLNKRKDFEVDNLANCERDFNSGKKNISLSIFDYFFVRGNIAKVMTWSGEAAEAGSITAQLILGFVFYNGVGVIKNENFAINYFEQAALQGSSIAQFMLGKLLVEDENRKNLGMKYLRISAMQGNCKASELLSQIHSSARNKSELKWAYFWQLISNYLQTTKVTKEELVLSENLENNIGNVPTESCSELSTIFNRSDVESFVDVRTKREIQDLASKWQIAFEQNNLNKDNFSQQIKMNKKGAVDKEKKNWVPIQESFCSTVDNSLKMPLTELYKFAADRVWKVTAYSDKINQNSKEIVSQGSAIAISEKLLLTNCHVIGDNPILEISKPDSKFSAKLIIYDFEKDTCVIESENKIVSYFSSLKRLKNIEIGEDAIA